MKTQIRCTFIITLLCFSFQSAWAYRLVDNEPNRGSVDFDLKWEVQFKTDVLEIAVTPGKKFTNNNINLRTKVYNGATMRTLAEQVCNKSIRPSGADTRPLVNGSPAPAIPGVSNYNLNSHWRSRPFPFYFASSNLLQLRFHPWGNVEVGKRYVVQLRSSNYADVFSMICSNYWRYSLANIQAAKQVSMLNDALNKVRSLESHVSKLKTNLSSTESKLRGCETKVQRSAHWSKTSAQLLKNHAEAKKKLDICTASLGKTSAELTQAKISIATANQKVGELGVALANTSSIAKHRLAKIHRMRARIKRKNMRLKRRRLIIKRLRNLIRVLRNGK